VRGLLVIVICLKGLTIYSQGTNDTFQRHYVDTSKYSYEPRPKAHTITFFIPVIPDNPDTKNFLDSDYIIVSLLNAASKEIWQSDRCPIINIYMN
jgi:hypothetical protein